MYCLSKQQELPDILKVEADRWFAGLESALSTDDSAKQYLTEQGTYLKKLLAVSPFIAGQLTMKPEQWIEWVALLDQPFKRDYLQADIERYFSDIEAESELLVRLRRFRILYTMAIAWRDLSGAAELDETLAYLSGLSDQLIRVCLSWYYRQLSEVHGSPVDATGQAMSLVVLAMGKLGAEELNFSSDIDLILAYESDGQTQGKRPLSHHDFFIRLAQKLSRGLGEMTADGFVYRVDLRLRPYGDSGPIVMGFDAMESYYQTQGREWERYAMIKARPTGMDVETGQRLLDQLKPFVYRRYLDFGVIQSLRELKAMINREVVRKDRQNNLKLGPGGIREIEFIAQVFQLMRGGQDVSLQSRGVQIILNRLSAMGYITHDDGKGLVQAYRFLRVAENHIQEMYDRQEHSVPVDKLDRQRLVISMGFQQYADFLLVLDRHRHFVQRCFDQIFAAPDEQDETQILRALWQEELEASAAEAALAEAGYRDVYALIDRLKTFRHRGVYQRLSRQGQERADTLIPELLVLGGRYSEPDETIKRLFSVISAIAQRESYLALLVEAPSALEQLVRLCSESQWITQVITRQPVLLDELIDPRRLYSPPDRETLYVELTQVLANIDDTDVEMGMERLRQFKQAQQLRIAAADIMETMPLMIVSDQLTWLAESLVNVALELAWDYLAGRHGVPCYQQGGRSYEAQFSVIGYGKLGGIELGYGSDLDLLFVHDSHGQAQQTNGERPIENPVFFTRLAQRFVHLLSTRTPAGVLYEIDTRLRPDGKAGLLVTSLDSLLTYQREEAWIWEHQALVRARPIAGGAKIMADFEVLRDEVLALPREEEKLRSEVLTMRDRMREELDRSSGDLFDLKHGIGGIVDIEFMVQYLVLRWANERPEFLRYTDVVRLLETASDTGKIDPGQGNTLKAAYRTYRRSLHHLVLQDKDRCVGQNLFAGHRQQVKAAWRVIFDIQP